jgi:trimeric autotransporter adhesin
MNSYLYTGCTRLFFVFCLSTACRAQGLSLSLSSSSANRGASTTLNLSLGVTTGGQPASLEWTVTYSPTDFSSAGVAAGPAATQASKSVFCENLTGSMQCILSGLNSGTIPNGVVATVSLNVSASTSNTSSPVKILAPAAANPSAGAILASASGGTVTIVQTPGLNGFSCSPVSITPSTASTCTVALTSAAGSGGATVSVSSSPVDVNLPSAVTVPQGATSTTFSVTAKSVTRPTPVAVTASYAGASETFGLTVNPPPPVLSSVTVTPSTIVSGQSGTGTVSLASAAGSGGAVVSLSSSNTAAAKVPVSVTVPQGSTSATFSVTTGTVSTSTSVTLTASYAGAKSVTVVINPARGRR